MAILSKNYYRTAKGEKKLNCYGIKISKEIVKQAGLEDKQIKVYVKGKKIIIEEN